jgi:uncharacterized protein (TIGR03437 family)
MSHSNFTKILVVLVALLACVSLAQADVLSFTPATVALTFQKPATVGSGVGVSVKATTSTFFAVEPTSVPFWLTMSAMSGTANSTGVTVTFTPSALGATLGAGSYYANVNFDVVGSSALTVLAVPVSLVVTDPAPTVTVTGGSGLTFNWTQASTFPTQTLQVFSSNEPVAFTVSAAVSAPTVPANWVQVNHTSGVAYSWGTPVVVSFNQLVAVNANIGSTLAGTVTITPAGGTAIVTNVAITVTPPVAAITSLWPAAIPPQASAGDTDTYNIMVIGTGFVSGTTAVTVAGTSFTTGLTVVNGSTMILAIPSKANLKTAGSVVITAKNNTPDTAASRTLSVTAAPIIYAVTNSASYQQESPGATPNVAPYELISIFGDNFGPTGSTVVPGSPDSFGLFSAALPTTSPSTVVNFYKWVASTSTSTFIAAAPLLFVSQQQINVVVPAGVAGTTAAPITQVKISVSYNGVEGVKQLASVVAADPGIFTTAANGTGQGAILNSDYTANSSAFAAKAGNTVMIYMAGLGAPTSAGANTTATTAPTYPAKCLSTANYMAAVNGASSHPNPLWSGIDGIDGAVIESSLFAANTSPTGGYAVFPPCMATAPTVTIGGKSATVSYAGWVADSVGGLYQINATVPASGVTPGNSVPVLVTVGTGASAVTSQPGVTMAVVATGGH